ncbi:hypothetical protein DD630_01315 [Streptomyces sp. BSE7F]|nr:hypothetical protein DD630_01315 [Streptomyces sp. BSE7F]
MRLRPARAGSGACSRKAEEGVDAERRQPATTPLGAPPRPFRAVGGGRAGPRDAGVVRTKGPRCAVRRITSGERGGAGQPW